MLIKNIIPGIFSTAHAKPWRPVVHSSDGTQCLASAPPLSCTPAPWQLLPNEYMLDKISSEVMTQHTECTHSSAFLGCQVRGGATKAAPELPPQRHEQGHPDGSGVCCQPQEGDPGAAGALLCVSTCHGGMLLDTTRALLPLHSLLGATVRPGVFGQCLRWRLVSDQSLCSKCQPCLGCLCPCSQLRRPKS